MSMWKSFRIQVCGSVLLLSLLGACSPAFIAESSAQGRGEEPKVLFPTDRQKIGEGDDPLCPLSVKYCNKLRAEGQVPRGYSPFFAVEPVLVSPKTWIQPVISGVRKDGTFSGLIHLGEPLNGAEEYFKIYVLACKNKERLQTGDELMGPPKDCLVSDPVEVFRTR